MNQIENIKVINRVIQADDSVSMILKDAKECSIDDIVSSIDASNNEKYINKSMLTPEYLLISLIDQVDLLTNTTIQSNKNRHLNVTRVNLGY
jgi:hypothetical protein